VLAPGALSESTPHEKGVIEHVVAISGTLDMRVAGVWRSLTPGEGLRFAGDEAHAYRNSSDQPAHFHSLIHYPKEKTASELAVRHRDSNHQ
jgi:Cupin domain.